MIAGVVGLRHWQFERGEAAGMVPAPQDPRGWLPEQLDDVRGAVAAVVARFGTEHPVGARRGADRLFGRLGLPVHAADVEALAEAGHPEVVEVFEEVFEARRNRYVVLTVRSGPVRTLITGPTWVLE